jgi:hypothetical protein
VLSRMVCWILCTPIGTRLTRCRMVLPVRCRRWHCLRSVYLPGVSVAFTQSNMSQSRQTMRSLPLQHHYLHACCFGHSFNIARYLASARVILPEQMTNADHAMRTQISHPDSGAVRYTRRSYPTISPSNVIPTRLPLAAATFFIICIHISFPMSLQSPFPHPVNLD